MNELLILTSNVPDDDLDDIRSAIEPIIKGENLLTRYDAGWQFNTKTEEVIAKGGYVKYKAAINEMAALHALGQYSRDKRDILEYKYLLWINLAISLLILLLTLRK